MWWNNEILTLRNAEHWKPHPFCFSASTPLGDLNRRRISYPFVHRDLHIHGEVACFPIDHSTSQLQRWTNLLLVSPRTQEELTKPLVINNRGWQKESLLAPSPPQLCLASFKQKSCLQWSESLDSQADKSYRIVIVYPESFLICLWAKIKDLESMKLPVPVTDFTVWQPEIH